MTSRKTATKTGSKTGKRAAAIGVTAGLVGGGATGLVLGVPGLSRAAANDGAGITVTQVEPDSGGPDSGDATEVDETRDMTRDEARSARLRETLQALVDDGTLTDAQADAVVEHLAENRPTLDRERGPFGPGGRFGGSDGGPPGAATGVLTDVLGIDVEELREALQNGSTIAEVAEANGVPVEDVVDALVEEQVERLDEAVAEGRIDEETAADRAAALAERVTAHVNGEHPARGPRPAGDAEIGTTT